MITSFLIGIATGSMVVGSSVSRTIACERGEIKNAFTSSILNSVSYGASIYFIANNDWLAYGGSALGSTAICLYLAFLNKRKTISGDINGDKEGSTTRVRKKPKTGPKA